MTIQETSSDVGYSEGVEVILPGRPVRQGVRTAELAGVLVRQATFRRRRRRQRVAEWARLTVFVLVCTVLVATVAISVMGR